jgi:hypothetical protein
VIPSPTGCWEELLDPPDLASTTAAACSMFSGKLIGPLGFSPRGEYIGGRAMSGGGPGVTPQNRHLANYSNHATIRTMSLWKRTTKQNMHVATYTLCGWNQDSNVT